VDEIPRGGRVSLTKEQVRMIIKTYVSLHSIPKGPTSRGESIIVGTTKVHRCISSAISDY
jgi:hypothetical protein